MVSASDSISHLLHKGASAEICILIKGGIAKIRAIEKYRSKPVLYAFSNLIRTLLFDLKLDRAAQEYPCREMNAIKAYSMPVKQYRTGNRTNEERRAILASYIICVK